MLQRSPGRITGVGVGVLSAVRLDGRPGSAVHSDDERQLTTLTLAHALRPGVHTLTFSVVSEADAYLAAAPPQARSGGG
jgi:hypothetical protein